jgi:glycopeptide antibiotics resistance protein
MRKLLVLWLVGWAIFGFPWTTFTARPRFWRVNLTPFRWARKRDHVLNFAYYVPLGVIGVGLGLPSILVAAGAAALSVLTEFAQIFSTDRFPSTTDLLLNTAGAVAGIALGHLLALRPRESHNGDASILAPSKK